MSISSADFTIKFFRPTQRAVFSHSGLLDTRTKRIIAHDRFAVAEQRTLEGEKRKSASNLQFIAFEQKQIEKKLSALQGLSSAVKTRQRSVSEISLHSIHRNPSWNDATKIPQANSNISLQDQNQNILFLPTNDHFRRRFSTCSDEIAAANQCAASDVESDEDEQDPKNSNQYKSTTRLPLPLISVIPPECEDQSFAS